MNYKISTDLSRYLVIAALYLFVFQPHVVEREVYVAVESVVFFLIIAARGFRRLRALTIFKAEIILGILLLIFCLYRDAVSGEEVYLLRALSFLLQCVLFPAVFVDAVIASPRTKVGISYYHDEGLLIKIGIIAAISTVILYFYEDARILYESIIPEKYPEGPRSRFLRGVGFGENHTFSYTFTIAICFWMLISRAGVLGIWLSSLPVLFAIAVNARIGLWPIFFSLYALIRKRPHVVLPLVLVVLLIMIRLAKTDNASIFAWVSWLESFFSQLWYLISGRLSDLSADQTAGRLLFDSLILPDSLSSWVWGTGIDLFQGDPQGRSSDIGFTNQLYYGGLSFSIILYSFFTLVFFRLISAHRFKLLTVLLMLSSFIILNTKGSLVSSIPITRFFFIFYMYIILRSQNHVGVRV